MQKNVFVGNGWASTDAGKVTKEATDILKAAQGTAAEAIVSAELKKDKAKEEAPVEPNKKLGKNLEDLKAAYRFFNVKSERLSAVVTPNALQKLKSRAARLGQTPNECLNQILSGLKE